MSTDRSPFHTANQALKQLLHYFRYELQMPTDVVRQLVSGILVGFEVEEVYERERMLSKKPEGPV